MEPKKFLEPTPDIAGASPGQRARIVLAEKLGIGPFFTRAAVWAELMDKKLYGQVQPDHPSPVTMARFLERLIAAPSTAAKYELLTQPVPIDQNQAQNPELWFDYIEELTSRDIIRGIAETAHRLLPEGKSQWRQAADLGGGTGTLAASLIGEGDGTSLVQSITVVDVSPAMLKVAETRHHDRMKYVNSDVTKLPFPAQSCDLIVSSGLVYSLSRNLQNDYFKEVSRVLEPGGIYLDGDYLGSPDNSLSKHRAARAQLSWLIKGVVSGSEHLGNPLNGTDQEAFFSHYGLRLSNRELTDSATNNAINIRILQKMD